MIFLIFGMTILRMNEKEGWQKNTIPDSFILIIGHIRIYLHLPYRQTEELIKATMGKNTPQDKQPKFFTDLQKNKQPEY